MNQEISMTDTTALWTKDFQTHSAPPNIGVLLKDAASSVTKNPLALTFDWWKIKRAPGQVTFGEYLDFRIYNREEFDSETERRRFLSDELHWPLCYQCSDRKWDAATEDKWISETLMKQSGIGTTDTLAVLGGPDRSYGPVERIRDADHFNGLLREIGQPVFAKLNGGIASEGATRIVPLGDDRYEASGFGEMDGAALYEVMSSAPKAYLIQKELRHHPEMTRYFGERIGTIRAMTFISDNGARTPFIVLKLPAPGNIADNFWRPGNMLADIDQNSGMVRRLISGKGPEMQVLEQHPQSKKNVVGVTLPLWSQVQSMIDDVARLYAPVKFQSVDLAITDKGPAIVEINTGGAFNLPQIASGCGMLTDEFIDLLREAGGKLDTSSL